MLIKPDVFSGIRVEGIWLTPELAREFLGLMPKNRAARSKRVDAICRDILAGNYVLSHQGIAFDTDGRFVDGQHRCLAVIATGISIPVFVFRGMSKASVKHVDGCLPRSILDSIRLAECGDFSTATASVARCFESAPNFANTGGQTADEVIRVIRDHWDGIAFQEELLANRDGMTRGVRTLIARAFYHVDPDRLNEFCRMITTGLIVDPHSDSSAVTYRNFLMKLKGQTGCDLERERYEKGQSALKAFLNRTPLGKVYRETNDVYPVITRVLVSSNHSTERRASTG